jgi:hypothetical protein
VPDKAAQVTLVQYQQLEAGPEEYGTVSLQAVQVDRAVVVAILLLALVIDIESLVVLE